MTASIADGPRVRRSWLAVSGSAVSGSPPHHLKCPPGTGVSWPVHVDAMTIPQPLGPHRRHCRPGPRRRVLRPAVHRNRPHRLFNAAVASQAAPGLELSTGVAVAFPRSPFVTAATAWELQEATGGRFRLGLGTQVRTHVVRRYGVPSIGPDPGCATTCWR